MTSWSPPRTRCSAGGVSSTTNSTTKGRRAARPATHRRSGGSHIRHTERGRTQAGADRSGPDDRSRAVAAGRACGPGPCRRETLVNTLGELAQDHYAPASVLVTHHVEEIPAGVTHVMLLRGGKIVAAGPLRDTLTAENLTKTFDVELSLAEADGRWTARAL